MKLEVVVGTAAKQKPRKTPKIVSWEKSEIISTCAQRDGWRCFYCTRKLTRATATIEHFVARANGGPNHVSNYGLTCQPCNLKAANRSVVEKFVFALGRRAETRASGVASTFRFIAERNARAK